MAQPSERQDRQPQVWVIGSAVDQAMLERTGDARRVADQLGVDVGAFVVEAGDTEAEQLIARGVDRVCYVASRLGLQSVVATAIATFEAHRVRVVFAAGDCKGREWAALLAVRLGWYLVSPALMVRVKNDALEVTGLDRRGRLARNIRVASDATVVLTMRPSVAEALKADPQRAGGCVHIDAVHRPETVAHLETIQAAPDSVDIRYAERLVAGGRGLGCKAGFDTLRRFADRIGAGLAASRMAVDLGWIDRERQVGQTGKTVSPDLYLACGISGASHHLEGMAGAAHIVAINTDPEAPIFKVAQLGLVADLYEVLERAEEGMSET